MRPLRAPNHWPGEYRIPDIFRGSVERPAPTSPIFDELRGVQRAHGYLPEGELRALAERLGIPLFRLQAVASFYPHFFLKPPARAEVRVCGDIARHRYRRNDPREPPAPRHPGEGARWEQRARPRPA